MAVVESKTLPTVTPPWLQQAQQSPQQQKTQQSASPQQQQQQQVQQPKFDYTGVASKLFSKPIGNALKPYFGAGGGATGINSAVSAGGGSYATGSGLAGTASPINTTAGAAGKLSSGGGFSAGLANAGAGLIGGYVGGRLFGGKQSGSLAGVGASIGMATLGPMGAVLGTIFGGIAGKLFGSEDEPYIQFSQGANASKVAGKGVSKRLSTQNTALGKFQFASDEIPGSARNHLVDAVKKSDASVAELFSPDQLDRVKAGMGWFEASQYVTKPKGDRVENMMDKFFKERYSMAVGGLDLDYKSTFDRIANDKNMGGLIQTMSQMDKDITSGSGVFADFNPNRLEDGLKAGDIRLQQQIDVPNPNAGKRKRVEVTQQLPWGPRTSYQYVPEPATIKAANPQYDAALAKQFNASQVVSGYNYDGLKTKELSAYEKTQPFAGVMNRPRHSYSEQKSTGSRIGGQAMDHIAAKYDLGNRPPPPAAAKFTTREQALYRNANNGNLGAMLEQQKAAKYGGTYKSPARTAMDKKLADRNAAQTAAYNKQLGAWEKKVLDVYANNYSQGQGSASNIASVGITRSNQDQSANAQGSAASKRNRLFGNVKQQSVKLNRANQNSDASTNAGGLLQQSEVA